MPEPDVDVVVVGAGAGGLAAAWRLATLGVRVTVLEAGARFEPQRDYPQDQPDFELRPLPFDPRRDGRGRPRYGFGAAQQVPAEYDGYRSHNRGHGRLVPGPERLYEQYSHVRGVGGSTLHFQGEAHRYPPGAFADWPIADAELATYYDLAERALGVAAPADNPSRPRSTVPPFGPHPLSYASQRLVPAFRAAGGTLLPNSLAILPRAWAGRPACNYCNSCTEGCPIGDKGSADVVFLPAALATGRVELRIHARAMEIEIDARGRAAAVVHRGPDGKQQRTRARFVLLAAGAVETPRLLLLSTSSRFPRGLANSSRQVGANLTESLFWLAVGLLPDRVDAHRGVPIDGTAWDVSPSHDFRVSTAHGALGLRGPVAYATRLVEGFGSDHQRRLAEVFGHGVGLLASGQWLPNPSTRVDLDPRLEDEDGLAVARIHSALGESELRLLRRMADTCRAILAAAGAEIVEETSALDLFRASHVLGTCRMGTDPELSVSDPEGFAHDVPNLGFADGSVVPTSGSGDAPSLTIMALALRTADRLLAR